MKHQFVNQASAPQAPLWAWIGAGLVVPNNFRNLHHVYACVIHRLVGKARLGSGLYVGDGNLTQGAAVLGLPRTVQRAVGAAATAASGVGKAAGLDLSAPNRRAVLTQGASCHPLIRHETEILSLITRVVGNRSQVKELKDLAPAGGRSP